MGHRLVSALVGFLFCAHLLSAQIAPGPSAWVYVSNFIGSTGTAEISAFTATSSGRLAPISGSPFSANLGSLAVNGLYLFGAGTTGTFIDTYRIGSNGALSFAAATNTARNGCSGSQGPVFLDHSGASLYNLELNGDSICSNNTYQDYTVVKATGQLTFLGTSGGSESFTGRLTFIGNNQFAYTSNCYHGSPTISGFRRNSNGSLTPLSYQAPLPKAPYGQGYCPHSAAADPSNHLAIPMQPYNMYTPAGPYQLASYTVNSNGTLATAGTSSNMPKVSVGSVTTVSMSPSGKLLAVAGTAGLQVFHFNGGYPITKYTGLMLTSATYGIAWDNNNHLYATSYYANKVSVFTVTPTAEYLVNTYSVNKPLDLIVQPLPLPWR